MSYLAQHAARFETAIAQAIQTMLTEQPADPVMRVGQLLLGASHNSEVEALKSQVQDLERRLAEKEAALCAIDKSEPTNQPKTGLASLIERARQAQPTAHEDAKKQQAKFAESAFTLSYTGLDTFFKGLESLVGIPSPNLRLAMRAEHCGAADSAQYFTTNNYGVTTTSTIEWWAVVDPAAGLKELKLKAYPSETFGIDDERKRATTGLMPLKEFLPALEAKNAALRQLKEPELLEEELLAGRLYTGPMVRRGLASPHRLALPSHRRASPPHSFKSTTSPAVHRSTRRRSS